MRATFGCGIEIAQRTQEDSIRQAFPSSAQNRANEATIMPERSIVQAHSTGLRKGVREDLQGGVERRTAA